VCNLPQIKNGSNEKQSRENHEMLAASPTFPISIHIEKKRAEIGRFFQIQKNDNFIPHRMSQILQNCKTVSLYSIPYTMKFSQAFYFHNLHNCCFNSFNDRMYFEEITNSPKSGQF
jgi:hypothetical protein